MRTSCTEFSRFLGALTIGSVLALGCEKKEPIVDIETPAGQVEVERDRDSGQVDVEVTDNE